MMCVISIIILLKEYVDLIRFIVTNFQMFKLLSQYKNIPYLWM